MIGIKKAILLLVTAISLTSLLTCSNPFSAGLGDKVDLEAPSLEIKSHRNGDAVGSTFELAGTVTDDGTVESLKISLDSPDNVIGSATIDGTTWNYTYDSSELTDGDHEFTFVAIDNTDKSVSTKLLLTVDNNPPTVMVNVPAAYGSDKEFNKNITIKGDTADTTRVKEVFITLYDASDDSKIIEKASATGTTSWYYTFNSENIAANILEGNYYFFVTAEDYSGNSNDYFYHFADIYEAAQDPANLPNVEDIHEADYGGVPLSSTIFKDSTTLKDLRKTTADNEKMLIHINPNSDKPQFTFISPSIVESPADPLQENVFSSSVRLSGFVEDDDGVNFDTLQIKISKIDSSYNVTSVEVPWTTIPAENISGTQWIFEPALEDGDYKVDLRVEDIYGTEKTTDGISVIPFRISSLAPAVTITNPNQGSYVGTSSSIDVQTDIKGLSSSGTVEIDPTGDDDWTDALAMNGSGDGLYTRTMTSGTEFTPIDGQITFKIRAGVEGSYGTGTLQLTGDITPPTVKVEVPAEGNTVNGVFDLAGTSSDNNIVRNVYLWIEENADSTTAPPADFTTWNTPDSTDIYNWFYNIESVSFNNGDYSVHLKAVDAAGNKSADYTRIFTIDQESDRPVISLSNMVIGGTGLENGLGRDASVIGLIEDDDGVEASSIKIQIDIYDDDDFSGVDLDSSGGIDAANESEQWVPVSAPPGSDSRIVDWSHSLLNVPQGTHSLQIRAHDVVSDGTNELTSNTNYNQIAKTQFIIDYGPPDLIITDPPNGSIFNSPFSISGTASDANGVNDVEISINDGAFSSVMNSTDQGSTNVSWNYDFGVDPSGIDDGDYSYQIQATDISGGKTTLDRQLVVDATAPQVSYSLPANGSTVNGNEVTVSGTASDNRNVRRVYQYIEAAGTDPSNDLGQWHIMEGTYSWSSFRQSC